MRVACACGFVASCRTCGGCSQGAGLWAVLSAPRTPLPVVLLCVLLHARTVCHVAGRVALSANIAVLPYTRIRPFRFRLRRAFAPLRGKPVWRSRPQPTSWCCASSVHHLHAAPRSVLWFWLLPPLPPVFCFNPCPPLACLCHFRAAGFATFPLRGCAHSAAVPSPSSRSVRLAPPCALCCGIRRFCALGNGCAWLPSLRLVGWLRPLDSALPLTRRSRRFRAGPFLPGLPALRAASLQSLLSRRDFLRAPRFPPTFSRPGAAGCPRTRPRCAAGPAPSFPDWCCSHFFISVFGLGSWLRISLLVVRLGRASAFCPRVHLPPLQASPSLTSPWLSDCTFVSIHFSYSCLGFRVCRLLLHLRPRPPALPVVLRGVHTPRGLYRVH